jgi:hypothetical protein
METQTKQEHTPELLDALRHLHTAVQGHHAGFVSEDELDAAMRRAAEVIARATPTESED